MIKKRVLGMGRGGTAAWLLAGVLVAVGCGSSSGGTGQGGGRGTAGADAGMGGSKDAGAGGGTGGTGVADAGIDRGTGGDAGMVDAASGDGNGGDAVASSGGAGADEGGGGASGSGGASAIGGASGNGGTSGRGGAGMGGAGGGVAGAGGSAGTPGANGGAAGGAAGGDASFSPCGAMGIASIRAIAYLPDGSGVVAALAGGVAKIIAPVDGHEVRTFIGHAGGVNAVAVSADGATLATASDDRTVKLWRISDGGLLTTLAGQGRELLSVAISPDGTRIAAGAADGQVFLWSGTSGALLATKTDHTDEVRGIGFAAAGARVFTASKDGSMRVWSSADLTALATPVSGGTWMNAVAVSADGAHVAVGDVGGGLTLWHAADATLERMLQAEFGIRSLAYAPDGTRVYAGIDGPDVTAFPINGSASALILAPIGDFALVAAAPDGRSLFIATDWALWLTDQTGTTLRDPLQQGPLVRDVAFTPDGARLVIGGDFGLVARALPGGAVVQSPDWSQFAATYNGVVVSSDGAHLVTAEESGAVHLWSTATWQITSMVAQATLRAEDVALSPDGTLVAVAGAQGAGEVYRTATGAIVTGFGTSDDSHSVTFSPDGALLAIGTETGGIGIVNTADWSDARRITDVHSSTVADLAFSLDDQLIASTGDERVTVWQTTGSAPRNDLFTGPSDFIGRTVAISPDGATLVAGGTDGELRSWSVPALAPLPALPGHGPGVVKARFSPDGQSLAVAYDDGTVWLWCRP